ncbi:hypothetical protein GCM10009663_31130 [Kitasatospora arboriphila]|uniref:Uncharacterized protein n=1 Tax=Kitasatospora arboriphila TaxID=258052 RepID=A0ABN1THG3_9ACTN
MSATARVQDGSEAAPAGAVPSQSPDRASAVAAAVRTMRDIRCSYGRSNNCPGIVRLRSAGLPPFRRRWPEHRGNLS